ncbi:EthD family reductase [Arthrobacter castelli]|uniref:EthD family reductase n=1 Tax=Arthrobacter castelli TaxID=271431 RepID=UPI00047A4E07|nr:EthD family reductase [Arthrobacter castelli]
MYRVSILYGTPTDLQAFDHYYREVHIPIAKRMRGLTRWTLTWVGQQDGDMAPAVHLIADLYAADEKSMDAVLTSDEGQAAAADVDNFATGGVTFLYGNEETVL